MNIIEKTYKHLRTITKHKILVMYYCFRCGIVWRGLMHDNSKYFPIEFLFNIRYYDGNRSPIVAAKEKIGYSIAWQHHKGHNPHHWEYWIDNVGTYENKPIEIPHEYLIEMMCDWIAAGKTYLGDKWTQDAPLRYFKDNKVNMILHPNTEKSIQKYVTMINDYGLSYFYKHL